MQRWKSLQKHKQRRYNVAATSRRCSDAVTTLLRRGVFAGNLFQSTHSHPVGNLIGTNFTGG